MGCQAGQWRRDDGLARGRERPVQADQNDCSSVRDVGPLIDQRGRDASGLRISRDAQGILQLLLRHL